ncbi:O-antigen polymerase [Pontibacter kalidii]|uniref:O-antigen polymerase n=1 Tax=Pontibacter kalidii TaxID=2592049 RepID=UPI00224E572C|nr:O-antigen polymerase [Pontibacter kalidii]
MRVPIKINFSHPVLYAVGFVFLFTVPYLYPSIHFRYTKVFSPSVHLLISSFVALLVILSYYLSKISFAPNKLSSKPYIPYQFIWLCKAGLLVALLMNILIVLHAFAAYNGNILSAKESIEAFGGINILSQTYMFFLPPYIYYSYRQKKKHKLVLLVLGFVLLIRSVLMAERVAFLEFLVPVFVTYFLASERKLYVTKILKYFSLLLLFFMVLELSRQFYNQYILSGGEVNPWFALSWTLERFFAYYADTANKFYYSITHDLAFTTHHYLYPFERIISRIAPIDMEQPEVDYGEFRWVDFTNAGGLNMFYTDFGFFSIFAFVLLFVAFFKSFRSIQKGSLIALCLYPNLVTVILELARFVNLYNTRFFVPLVIFIIIYTLYKYLVLRFPKGGHEIQLNTIE